MNGITNPRFSSASGNTIVWRTMYLNETLNNYETQIYVSSNYAKLWTDIEIDTFKIAPIKFN